MVLDYFGYFDGFDRIITNGGFYFGSAKQQHLGRLPSFPHRSLDSNSIIDTISLGQKSGKKFNCLKNKNKVILVSTCLFLGDKL